MSNKKSHKHPDAPMAAVSCCPHCSKEIPDPRFMSAILGKHIASDAKLIQAMVDSAEKVRKLLRPISPEKPDQRQNLIDAYIETQDLISIASSKGYRPTT